MASYRISEDAKADLRRIYRHGVREYGDALADQYYDAFIDRFEELVAVFPFVRRSRGYSRTEGKFAVFEISTQLTIWVI
jgi:toxin ParE1/3/4